METISAEQTFLKHIRQRYGIVGGSAESLHSVRSLAQVAPTDLTVLIVGETGTGKEVFAQAMHGLSKRRKYPLVSVNCGAIPETLLESELFGHEKGAFTGAVEQRKGFFEAANNGTIFLDEIGDMPAALQVKLLRVLESGEFSRVGSPLTQKVDVRVIAATHRDLEIQVQNGEFRQDLFFRLNSVRIILPPLRKRPEDIPELAEYFANQTSEKIGVEFQGISDEALHILQHLPWHGNIRELRSFIETMVTLERGSYIDEHNMRRHLRPALPPAHNDQTAPEASVVPFGDSQKKKFNESEPELIYRSLLELTHSVGDLKRGLALAIDEIRQVQSQLDTLQKMEKSPSQKPMQGEAVPQTDWTVLTLFEAEKKLVNAALSRCQGNRRMAAQELGISERTLYRKIHEFDL